MLQETVAADCRAARNRASDRRLQRESSVHGRRTAARMRRHAAGDRARAGGAQHGAGRRDRRAGRQPGGGAAGGDPVLLVLPADHVIRDVRGVPGRGGRRVARRPRRGSLVTFGVVPDRVETGYGYIRRAAGTGPVFRVAEFVEKPDAATARRYVESGEYYWNSGMFMFRASVVPGRARPHAPGDTGGLPSRARGRGSRPRFHAAARPGVRCLPVRFHRLRGHGEDRMPRSSCRSMRAGATSGPGPRSPTRCRATRTAT